MGKWLWIGGIAIVLLMVVGWFIGIYNGLVVIDQNVKESWSQVENQLQRRSDLIPNLVETVKGYATHEKSIFVQVAEARAKLAGAKTVGDKISAANDVSNALSRLLMVVENYPQLKADVNFRQLMDNLEGTENRIAVARGRYNIVVKEYNTKARSFPTVTLVGIFGFDATKPFFEAAEGAKEVPKVKFTQ
ncbi:MAG: LemA family protein [bacterium]